MLRSRVLVSFCVVFFVSMKCFAQSPSSSGGPFYVTVAFNAAVLQTAEAKRLFADLQTKFAPRQAHLQQLNTEVEALKKQINDSAATLSDADKSAKAGTLDREEQQLQRDAEEFKSDADSASQQAFQSVAQKMYALLQDYAKQRGYTLVIDRGSDTAPVVWYAAPGADITAELIKAYDVRGGAAPAGRGKANPGLPPAPTPH